MKAEPPLHLASKTGYTPMLDLLLTKGAHVHSQDNTGRVALHYAVLSTRNDAALQLLSKGAAVDARDKKGWTPLYLA